MCLLCLQLPASYFQALCKREMAREAESSSCFTIAPRLLRRRAKMVFPRGLLFPGGYLPGFMGEAGGVGTWRLWKALWMVGMT